MPQTKKKSWKTKKMEENDDLNDDENKHKKIKLNEDSNDNSTSDEKLNNSKNNNNSNNDSNDDEAGDHSSDLKNEKENELTASKNETSNNSNNNNNTNTTNNISKDSENLTKDENKKKEENKKKDESNHKSEVEEDDEETEEAVDDKCGVLIICGGTNWDLTGRKELPKSLKNQSANPKNLWGPHRYKEKIRVKEIISSCCACHSIIITEKGQAMTFGRNDKGQLGLGDLETRSEPVLVTALQHEKVVSAGAGKNHTLFLTERGTVYACGDNKMGQLGIGSQSSNILNPTRISHSGPPIVKVACGGEFSMIVDALGALYSFGSPEHGQLAHNSEGKFFTTGNKISFHCETTPRRILVFIEKTREGHIIPLDDVRIVDVACGPNHTLAIDTKKRCFTWGFAGYGRLGHSDTKNEMMPRNLKVFDYINRGIKKISAGSTYCLALDENGSLYFWGQAKSSGEATMYPKIVQDLNGWNVRSVGAANKSIVVAADESVISWGPSPTFGELGYGENKQKSSTTPQEVKLLEGIYVNKVTCGYGHTLMIAKDIDEKARQLIQKLPTWP